MNKMKKREYFILASICFVMALLKAILPGPPAEHPDAEFAMFCANYIMILGGTGTIIFGAIGLWEWSRETFPRRKFGFKKR